MSRQEHEQAHQRHRRTVNQPHNGGPHQEVTREALNRSRQEDYPWPQKRGPSLLPWVMGGMIRCGVGVEDAGESAGVGADVLEDGHGVER